MHGKPVGTGSLVLGFSVPEYVSAAEPERRGEHEAVRTGSALLAAPWERRIDVSGADAAAFLHNLLTQKILGLEPGRVAPAALSSRKGHLLADLTVLSVPEGGTFHLRVPAPAVDEVLGVLERHRIMEDVVFQLAHADPGGLLLSGPGAARLCADLGWASSEQAEGGSIPGFDSASWMRVRETTPDDRVVFADSGNLPAIRSELISRGARPIGWAAFDLRRIEVGRAWYGIDADSERLVPEPGFEDRISYDKGCYLGQEPLARLHYRGRPNWGLVRLRAKSGCLAPGLELRDRDGRRVGWVTSFRVGPGGGLGLGYLHRKFREDPGPLQTEDGSPLEWDPGPRFS